jgi:ADP-ribosylarginine hydrolase
MLHGGDSDSTGTIAAAWYGALYGMKGVPASHTGNPEGKE